ncbi:glutamate decarboxylase, partial [Salmonella enterica subsp. enterica serovar Weslaco]
RIQSMAVNPSRLTTRSMNVNTGHETLSQSDHYTSIQPIRGITRYCYYVNIYNTLKDQR